MYGDFSQRAGLGRQTRVDFSNGPGWVGKREINFLMYRSKEKKKHHQLYLRYSQLIINYRKISLHINLDISYIFFKFSYLQDPLFSLCVDLFFLGMPINKFWLVQMNWRKSNDRQFFSKETKIFST